jgi:signal transduction histidine kinase
VVNHGLAQQAARSGDGYAHCTKALAPGGRGASAVARAAGAKVDCSYLLLMGTSDDRWGSGSAPDAPLRALFELLTSKRAEIQARWEDGVRRVLGPEAATDPDPVGDLIERVGAGSESTPTPTEVLELAGSAGEDLVAAVTRATVLRDAVTAEWQSVPRGGAPALRMLDQALDRAILEAAIRSSARRDRHGRALDRLTSAARAGAEPEALLRVLLEESAVIDGAAVLLREGDHLRVVAATGVGADQTPGRLVPAGEGFPGQISSEPVLARWGRDPLGPPGGGSCVLLGCPLPDGAGVFYLVSLTAADFPEDDRRLFQVTRDHLAAIFTVRSLAAARQEVERLRADLAAKDQGMAQLAHDLRTPVGVVLMQAGAMQHARNSDDAARTAKRAGTLQRAAVRMQRIVADFVDFSELRGPAPPPLTMDSVDPVELLRKTVETFRATAQERRIVLEAELSPGLPAVTGDGERLSEVLAHLVRAALEGVADGGRIALRAQHDARGVVFSVDDDAPSLDPEGRGDLFDKVWSGERLVAGRNSLGLAAARGIVEQHGGRIWSAVTGSPGNSLCFDLPTARA